MSEFSARRVPGLDLIRSVAILLVVVAHYWPLWERFPALGALNWGGFFGVELFFVLSGFLIGGILLRQAAECAVDGGVFGLAQVPHFWMRRWFRTLPNYVLFFGLFMLYHQPWKTGHWQAWWLSAFFLQNVFVDLSQGVYGISWSLCVEEWMYLLLPLLLVGFGRAVKVPARTAWWAVAALIVVPTLLRCATADKTWDLGVRHVVVYRLDAIAYGVLLAYLRRYRRDVFARVGHPAMAVAGAAVLLGEWFLLSLHTRGTAGRDPGAPEEHWFVMNVLVFACTSVATIPVIAWASALARLPYGCGELVYRTSLYSYAMYLCHPLVTYWTNPVLAAGADRLFGQFRGTTFLLALLNVGAIYAASALVYHVWEGPLTRLRERFAPTQRPPLPVRGGTGLAVPVANLP